MLRTRSLLVIVVAVCALGDGRDERYRPDYTRRNAAADGRQGLLSLYEETSGGEKSACRSPATAVTTAITPLLCP